MMVIVERWDDGRGEIIAISCNVGLFWPFVDQGYVDSILIAHQSVVMRLSIKIFERGGEGVPFIPRFCGNMSQSRPNKKKNDHFDQFFVLLILILAICQIYASSIVPIVICAGLGCDCIADDTILIRLKRGSDALCSRINQRCV